jgi:anti-sigma factor RsiW
MNPVHETWDDLQLAAFIDGELDATVAARIEAQLAHDAALAMRVARQRRLRAQLHAAFDPVLQEPVPPKLLAALQGRGGAATPIGIARPGTSRPKAPPLWWGAAAASVMLALVVGWMLPRGNALLVPADEGLLASGALEQALSTQASGAAASAGAVHVSLSFQATDGAYCRAFSLPTGVDGLACRQDGRWRIEATGRAPRSAGEEYRQAGTPLSPSVVAAISGRQQADVLTQEEELQVLERGWR